GPQSASQSARPQSLRSFARALGVNEKSVRKAVNSGRLRLAVGRDDRGRPVIVDTAVARQEWDRNRTKVSPTDRTLVSLPSQVAVGPDVEAGPVVVFFEDDILSISLEVSLADLEREVKNYEEGYSFIDAEINREQAINIAHALLKFAED